MTVVSRVRRGYAILAALLLVTAALYAVKYVAIDRPNAADRVTEQRLTAVSQTVPTSVALYSAWINKGLLYGGIFSAKPLVLDNKAKAARDALSAMAPHVQGTSRRPFQQLDSTYSRFLTDARTTFADEQAAEMGKARVLATGSVSDLTENTLTANEQFRQAMTAALSQSRSGRDTLGTVINIVLVIVFVGAALVSVVMVVRIPRDISVMVRDAIRDLETTTTQVSAVSAQLASSATETAAAVSEAATTVDEVRQASLLASQKSAALSDKAREAETVAEAGRAALTEIVTEMDEIRAQVDLVGGSIVALSEQTEAIAALTSTSSDIAEQSNLLAVNAAIEAAKSEQQSAGFAVVAEEIRNLASQSRGAVQQVRGVLTDSLAASGSAVTAAERSGAAIGRSIDRVAGSSDAIETLAENVELSMQSSLQIAAASQQQLLGMDQIGQSMESINAASAQNASAAHEMAEEMVRLREVAVRLRSMIGTSGTQGEEAKDDVTDAPAESSDGPIDAGPAVEPVA